MPFDVLFNTNRFNLSEARPYFINTTCFGDDLASWLRGKLQEKGLATIEPDQEDWGWYIESTYEGNAYFIGIGGNADDSNADPDQGEWRVIIETRRSLRDKLAGKNKMSGDESIIAVIREILLGEPDIENVRVE